MEFEFYEQVKMRLHAQHFPHRNYDAVYRVVEALAKLSGPGTVVMVVGPTKVGKSHMSRQLYANLVKSMTSENGSVPVAMVETTNAVGGFFSLLQLTRALLDVYAHPIFHTPDLTRPDADLGLRFQLSEPKLRPIVEECMRRRGALILVLDEAHHCLKVKGEEHRIRILDSLKCLGNVTGIVLVMFGGYELLKYGLDSAHFNGRLRIVRLDRYTDSKPDVKQFDRLLASLDEIVPMRPGDSLLSMASQLQHGSCGAGGLMIDWAEAAVAQLAAEGGRFLKPRHFESSKLVGQMATIMEDTRLGDQLYERLTLEKADLLADWDIKIRKELTKEDLPAPTKAKRRPFVRNPARDPIEG